MQAKSFKGVMSDDEESSEEEVVIKLDLVEYNYLRAEKNKFKVEGVLRKDFKTSEGKLIDVMYYGLIQ